MPLFKYVGTLLKIAGEDAQDTVDWNLAMDWMGGHKNVTTTPYTTVNSDTFLTFNVTSGTCNLISASSATIQAGKWYVIKNLAATSLTVDPITSGQTIDGAATVVLAQNESLYVYSDGANWKKGNNSAGSGESNTGANVGTTGAGTAGVFRDKTGVTLNFKRLVAGSGITLSDGADNVTITSAGGGGSNTLLDGVNHTDTLLGVVAQGDVIVGNATPKWARLAIGASGQVLRSNGTTAAWTALVAGDLPATIVYNNQNNSFGAFYHDVSEIGAPTTPAANAVRIYAKDTAGVSELYYKNDAGVERNLSAVAGGNHNLLDGSVHPDTVANTATLGSMIYADATPKWNELTGNITATKNFLTQTGTGSVSAAPVWGTIAVADLPTVTIAKGGTGQTTQTAGFDALAPTTTTGDLIYYNGTDNVRLAVGTSSQYLKGGTNPAWGSIAVADLPATIPKTDQSNTYSAAMTQIFQSSTGGAAVRLAAGTSPTTPVDGDLWYDSAAGVFKKRQGGVTTDMDTGGAGGDNLGNHTATQDLSMATFDINNVGYIEFDPATLPAATEAYIGQSAVDGDVKVNVPTGEQFVVMVNAVNQLAISDTTLDMLGNTIDNVAIYTSNATNPAVAGAVRLGNTENVSWRNAANSADISLTTSSSDRLTYGGVNVPTISSTDTFTNKTLTTPIITDYTNAQHGHTNAAGGGTIAIGTATTGTLAETRGGTNQTTYTTGDILRATGANTLGKLPIGTAGFVLKSIAGVPAWAAGGGAASSIIVDAAGGGNYTNITTAINTEGSNKRYVVTAGTYEFVSYANTAVDNILIEGSGPGNTIFQIPSTESTTAELFRIDGSIGTETAINTANIGDFKVTAPSGLAGFVVGDYILVSDDSLIDSQNAGRSPGEIHKIVQITGLDAFLDTPVRGTPNKVGYSNSPQIQEITFRKNIAFRNITFKSAQTASTLNSGKGQITMRYIRNLYFENCEFDSLWNAALQLVSTLDSRISNCYFHDTRDSSSGGTTEYGIAFRGACLNTLVNNSNFDRLRHSTTTGSGSFEGDKGMVEFLTVSNCASRFSNEAHWDTHSGTGDGILFQGCVAVGDDTIGATPGAAGFTLRGKVYIKDCIVGFCTKGVHLYGGTVHATNGTDTGGDGSIIEGLTCHDIFGFFDGTSWNNTGHAIFVSEGQSTTVQGSKDIIIDGLYVTDIDGSAISMQTGTGLHSNWTVKNVVTNRTNLQNDSGVGLHTIHISGDFHTFNSLVLRNNDATGGFPLNIISNVNDLRVNDVEMLDNTNNTPNINAAALFKECNIGLGITSITGTYTATAADKTIYAGNTTSYTVTVDAIRFLGQKVKIVKTGASGTLTIDPSGAQTISGSGTSKTTATQYDWIELESDGTNWIKIGGNIA